MNFENAWQSLEVLAHFQHFSLSMIDFQRQRSCHDSHGGLYYQGKHMKSLSAHDYPPSFNSEFHARIYFKGGQYFRQVCVALQLSVEVIFG